MNAMVVGADRLGNIPNLLKAAGIDIRRHVTGRVSAHQKISSVLPKDVDLLIQLPGAGHFPGHSGGGLPAFLELSGGVPRPHAGHIGLHAVPEGRGVTWQPSPD
jgi:hypothetical protein